MKRGKDILPVCETFSVRNAGAAEEKKTFVFTSKIPCDILKTLKPAVIQESDSPTIS